MHARPLRQFSRRRFLLLATAFLASWTSLQAQVADYSLSVAAESPALFKKGEPVIFTIHLKHNGQAVESGPLQWTLTKNGIPLPQNGTAELHNGSASVSSQLDEPGFLQCRVSFQTPDKAVLSAIGGAAIEPEQIAPSMPVPEDFDAFWQEQKQKLAAVASNPILTEITAPIAGVRCFDLQAGSIGAPVSAYFARPTEAQPKSLPAILLVHGAGVRSSNLGSAANWAKGGALAMDLNAHGIANGQKDDFYTELAKGELSDYRIRGRDSRNSVYFLGMFLRLIRAIDFLASQPEWDGHTLVVYGSSQGGAQALAAAGLDSRVSFFAAGVPAMCDHTGVKVGRINGWPQFVPLLPDGQPDQKAIDAIRYFDAVNFATRIKVPGIVSVGFIDQTCPPSSVYAAFNALTSKKEIFNDPTSGHAISPKAGEAMSNAVRSHLQSAKKNAH